ncbi:hypothetical protein [Novipirellula rosea]|uniref:DUF927 domain-containing protein n=1 Tax=Novipirellula rosea TaxID=1031540 RepID=A0ABP8N3T7_9BACT
MIDSNTYEETKSTAIKENIEMDNQNKSANQNPRWHRDEEGTYETRWKGRNSFDVKLANHGVYLVRVINKVKPRGTEVWCLLRFLSKSKPIEIRVKLENLVDERSFLLIAPLGFSFSALPKAFILFRECLMDDVANAEREAVVTELGWMLLDGQPVYVDAGEIIRSVPSAHDAVWMDEPGAAQTLGLKDINAACSDVPILANSIKGLDHVSVEVSQQLKRYRLKPARSKKQTKKAIRGFLDMLLVGDPNVMYPAFFSVIAAMIRDPKFVVFLYGPTGCLKTALGKLMLSLWIQEPSDSDCVAFNSTSMGIQARFARCGNVGILVDDYLQHSTSRHGGIESKRADDIIRAMGNGASRDRCNGDGSLRDRDAPRGLCIFTGEQMPDGLDSMLYRTISLSVDAETFGQAAAGPRPNRLDYFQGLAADGVFTQVTHTFVTWLAPRLSNCREALDERHLFDKEPPVHRRVLDAANVIQSAAMTFLHFAMQQEACTEEEADDHFHACSEALVAHVRRIHLQSIDDKPTMAFAEHISDGLLSGRAYIQIDDIDEYLESNPLVPIENLGYSAQQVLTVNKLTAAEDANGNSDEEIYKTVYRPNGTKIGCLHNGQIVDLIRDEAMTVANALARGSNSSPMPSKRAFGRLLKDDGWIASHEKDRNTQKARHGGVLKDVWRVHLLCLYEQALDWGQFDFGTYSSMKADERRLACQKRREANLQVLKDRIGLSQIETILNPILSPDEKDDLLKPMPPLGDAPSVTRQLRVAPPSVPDVPGYGKSPKDDLLA